MYCISSIPLRSRHLLITRTPSYPLTRFNTTYMMLGGFFNDAAAATLARLAAEARAQQSHGAQQPSQQQPSGRQANGAGGGASPDLISELLGLFTDSPQAGVSARPEPAKRPATPPQRRADSAEADAEAAVDALADVLGDLFGGVAGAGAVQGQQQSPPSSSSSDAGRREVLEDDTHYVIVFEAAGVRRDQVAITYADRVLRVEFERTRPQEARGLRVVSSTLGREGRVVQALRLGRAAPYVPPDAIKARLDRTGQLTVRVPKAAAPLDAVSVHVAIE